MKGSGKEDPPFPLFVSSRRLILLFHVLQDFQGEMVVVFRMDSLPSLAKAQNLEGAEEL